VRGAARGGSSLGQVIGLNGFLRLLPQPPMPDAAKSLFAPLAAAGYMLPLLSATQVLGGALPLLGMVPLGLLILAPGARRVEAPSDALGNGSKAVSITLKAGQH